MKLYIDGENMPDEGVYYLVTDDGEVLATHFCSNVAFAKGDLIDNRPERKEKYERLFGTYTVEFTDKEMSNELRRKNKERYNG